MKRRHLFLIAGAGAAAAGLGWHRWRAGQPLPADTDALWSARFPRPDGSELAMAALRGRPLLLNFWATWCPPCIKEMPALDRFAKAYGARVAVVGLAIDKPEPVREFLGRTPIGYTIALAGFNGAELSRKLGNERAALPFTVLLSGAGQVIRRKLGETTERDLREWANALR